MNRFLPLLILTYFIHANEIQFNAIDEHEDGTLNVSFNLEQVAYINSYALENPSRLVLEINDEGLLASKKLYKKDDMNDLKFDNSSTIGVYSKRSFVYDFLSSMRQKINDPLGKKAKVNQQ